MVKSRTWKYDTLRKHSAGTTEITLKLNRLSMERGACASLGNATAGSDHFIEPMIRYKPINIFVTKMQGRGIQIRPDSAGSHIRVRLIWRFGVCVLCIYLATPTLILTAGVCINVLHHHTKEKSQWFPDKLRFTHPGPIEMTGREAPGPESGSQTAIESAEFRARSGDPRRICLPC